MTSAARRAPSQGTIAYRGAGRRFPTTKVGTEHGLLNAAGIERRAALRYRQHGCTNMALRELSYARESLIESVSLRKRSALREPAFDLETLQAAE